MNDNQIAFFGLVSMIVVGIIGVLITAWVYSASCNNKWSSFEHRWGVMSGCQINLEGKWIPAESYYFKQE